MMEAQSKTKLDPLTRQAEARLLEFARSELFGKTFKEGMKLVEETAAYLDGSGRTESKKLSRGDALVYASHSMRLTTRLMQVASWLLVQRAVKEDEMSTSEARLAKYRIVADDVAKEGLSFVELAKDAQSLPAILLDLIARSDKIKLSIMPF